MAWVAFKFIVWFCKWRHKRNLAIALRHYERARQWHKNLEYIAEAIVAKTSS